MIFGRVRSSLPLSSAWAVVAARIETRLQKASMVMRYRQLGYRGGMHGYFCAYIQLLGVDALHSNLHVGTLARGVVIVEY